jgi:Lon protease-like protein
VSRLLPLFPLDLVLLPGIPLPLHIFEPRYREMISHCLEHKEPFGVVRAKEEGFESIGCTAEILTVTKRYEDGRMDIVTQGRDRFEVVLLNEELSYLQAEVILLADDPAQPALEEIESAVKLHGEILTLAGAVPENVKDIAGTLVSFHLAGSLPLDLEFKQQLLTMKSEPERVRTLISYFESILPNLRRAVHVRQKAGGNGHGD